MDKLFSQLTLLRFNANIAYRIELNIQTAINRNYSRAILFRIILCNRIKGMGARFNIMLLLEYEVGCGFRIKVEVVLCPGPDNNRDYRDRSANEVEV
jgi:hypothetical protein